MWLACMQTRYPDEAESMEKKWERNVEDMTKPGWLTTNP